MTIGKLSLVVIVSLLLYATSALAVARDSQQDGPRNSDWRFEWSQCSADCFHAYAVVAKDPAPQVYYAPPRPGAAYVRSLPPSSRVVTLDR